MSDVEMADAPTPISPSDQLRKEQANRPAAEPKSVNVTKPIPYTFDLGHLLVNDTNPISPNPSPETLISAGRDCAQVLINQLLSTCPVQSTPDGVYISLPDGTTPLPREKSIPKEKEPTKWEKFAVKRGIKDKKRDGNQIYDEATGEWVKKWGYKGTNKSTESSWLVEVDGEKEKRTGEAGDARKEKREERVERMKRQDRRQRANEKHSAQAQKKG
jgi:regulator of ribosome biosynthesis